MQYKMKINAVVFYKKLTPRKLVGGQVVRSPIDGDEFTLHAEFVNTRTIDKILNERVSVKPGIIIERVITYLHKTGQEGDFTLTQQNAILKAALKVYNENGDSGGVPDHRHFQSFMSNNLSDRMSDLWEHLDGDSRESIHRIGADMTESDCRHWTENAIILENGVSIQQELSITLRNLTVHKRKLQNDFNDYVRSRWNFSDGGWDGILSLHDLGDSRLRKWVRQAPRACE